MSVTSTIPHLARPGAVPQPSAPRRTALSLAPSRNRKARPKFFYAVVTVTTIVVIIVAQMLLSVAVSSGAYEIAGLQSQAKELNRSAQVVQQELESIASPQNLAANAEALGMVTNSSPAYLRLSDSAVLGSPSAASAAGAVISGDNRGLIPNSLLKNTMLAVDVQKQLAEAAAKKAAADAAAKAAATTGMIGTVAQTDPANAQDATGAPAQQPAAPQVTLPEGIPAPATH